MEKIITARHFHMDDALKAHITAQLDHLAAEYSKLTSARVVVVMQRALFFAEVILHGKRLQIGAKAQDTDLRKAIDMAVERSDRQLRKFLDKVHDHHHESLGHMEAEAVEKELAIQEAAG